MEIFKEGKEKGTFQAIQCLIAKEGYISNMSSSPKLLCILAQVGELKKCGEPRKVFVAEVRIVNGRILITENRIPRGRTWEVARPQDVLDFLLQRWLNVPIGEPNNWE